MAKQTKTAKKIIGYTFTHDNGMQGAGYATMDEAMEAGAAYDSNTPDEFKHVWYIGYQSATCWVMLDSCSRVEE